PWPRGLPPSPPPPSLRLTSRCNPRVQWPRRVVERPAALRGDVPAGRVSSGVRLFPLLEFGLLGGGHVAPGPLAEGKGRRHLDDAGQPRRRLRLQLASVHPVEQVGAVLRQAIKVSLGVNANAIPLSTRRLSINSDRRI